ncbi:MAG: putative DNA-binding protein [Polaromonas sp.]|jgi:hypothetical protein|nr:putative DNA-binding protein [Polaromonas sp.]
MSGAEKQAVIRDFKDAVNMSPQELTRWLEAAESKEVGYKTSQGDESVGHASGRRIIELLGKQEADFSDDDVQHARKVLGYIHRHMAQRPDGDITDTPWRYSLMNWGHDPQVKGG